MHPILFEVFGFPISSFGVMLAIAFLVGTWITALRMREEGLDPELASTLLLYVLVGGIGGSKLYFALDTAWREGSPLLPLLLSRGGITWYGGLLGAVALGALGCRVHGVPVRVFADCGAVGVAVGQAIGRIGCFLVGDDYGRPTDLPWGIAFPQGAPPTLERVHPTQLYEMAWLLLAGAWLWKRRRRSPALFAEYLVLNGAGRFAIEFLRVNPKVALGFTEPQWIGATLVVVGMLWWLRRQAVASPARPAGAA